MVGRIALACHRPSPHPHLGACMYLYRHKKSPAWWVEFRRRYGPHTGRKVRKSTGVTALPDRSKGAAEARKTALNAAEKIRTKTDSADLTEAEKLGATSGAPTGPAVSLTLEELRDVDLNRARAQGVSDRQIGNLTDQWNNHLLRILGPDRDARTIDEPLLVSYVAARRGEAGHGEARVRGQSIVRERQALFRGLKALQSRLRRQGVAYTLPSAPVIRKDPRDERQKGKLHDLGVLSRWLAQLRAAGHSTAAAQASLALQCGLRKKELDRFTLAWLLPADGVHFRLALPEWAAKSRDARTLAVHAELAMELVDLWEEGMPLSSCIVAGCFRKSWASAAKVIGYHQTITLRDLRHTFATVSLQRGGDLTATRDALGHAELESTQRYLSATEERVARAGLAVSQALLAHTLPTPRPPTPTPTNKETQPEGWESDRGERTRTSGLLLPKQARYQTAPHPDEQGIYPPPRPAARIFLTLSDKLTPMLQYLGDARPPLDAVRSLITSSDQVFAAVAYIKRTGVELLRKELGALKAREGTLEVLTTFDFGTTDPAALDRLTDLGASVRIFRGQTYHPKVYLGARGSQRQALLGSANLTGGGLLRNVEAGVMLTEAAAVPIHQAAHSHLHTLWSQSAVYQYGTILTRKPPVQYVASPTGSRFAQVWQQLAIRCVSAPTVQTASGQPNTLFRFEPDRGIRVGTRQSPTGKWVEKWMVEVVVIWLEAHTTLRLNTKKGSGITDCTRDLRVHRSSAVFAMLGALPGYRLHTNPAMLERL
jgi:integrase/HKD family nuclease